NPITEDWVKRVENDLERRISARKDGKHPIENIVFDFNPKGNPSGTSNPYSCLYLRSFIDKLKNRQIRTVAFVHNQVTRHTVLPVLAWDAVVMSEKSDESKGGEIGGVLEGQNEPLPDAVRQAYESEANRWGTKGALVLKMVNKNLVLVQAKDKKTGTVGFFK